jgi:hypothetical protein
MTIAACFAASAALSSFIASLSQALAPSPKVDFQVFPPDNAWHLDVSRLPVHPRSMDYLQSIGMDARLHCDFGTVWDGSPIGIPYAIVRAGSAPVAILHRAWDSRDPEAYGDESDLGPFPIPGDAPIEGAPIGMDDPAANPNWTGDRHVIVIDRDAMRLYELYHALKIPEGWACVSSAAWDLRSNALRPKGHTSADAAGLPIFPGLARFDEIERGFIDHAIRVTVRASSRGFIAPARHFASFSDDPRLPPMGLRLRLKASFDVRGFPTQARIVLEALKRYGMIVADNGGPLFLSGAPDPRWDDAALHALSAVRSSDLEVVYSGEVER